MDYFNQFYPGVQPMQYMQPPYQQTPTNPIQQYQPPKRDDNRFVWIQGREGAKAYPIVPNTTLIFLDDQQPYVYKKRTDMEGKTAEFKVYRLVEEMEGGEIDQPKQADYITREEFDSLSKSIAELKEALKVKSPSKSPYNKNYKGGGRNA